MAQLRDKAGRPVVVVTGMGVVTSLGAGKTDNWKKLVAGQSGIHTITRFPTSNLKTRIAGSVDFVPVAPYCAPALEQRLGEMAIEEAVTEAAIGSRGDFPGPLFLAVAPIEIEWPRREALARKSGVNDNISYDDLIRAASSGEFSEFHHRYMFGSVHEALAEKFGPKGSPISLSPACASGASSIQLGV
jgi:3-oxoacyl-[acyl-carrier-protein] synthase II